MKLYEIEKGNADYYGAVQYRFFSLYNGTRGAWYYKKEVAEKQGQKHQEIIEKLHLHPLYCVSSGEIK